MTRPELSAAALAELTSHGFQAQPDELVHPEQREFQLATDEAVFTLRVGPVALETERLDLAEPDAQRRYQEYGEHWSAALFEDWAGGAAWFDDERGNPRWVGTTVTNSDPSQATLGVLAGLEKVRALSRGDCEVHNVDAPQRAGRGWRQELVRTVEGTVTERHAVGAPTRRELEKRAWSVACRVMQHRITLSEAVQWLEREAREARRGAALRAGLER